MLSQQRTPHSFHLTAMVVVLAAALAYRYHSGASNSPLERKLSEQWQRTESFRRTSSDIVRNALACGSVEVTEHTVSRSEQPPDIPIPSRRRRATNTGKTPSSAMVFRDNVRQAWIDAVFGSDFFNSENYQAPRQGVGLAHIPSYTAYTATIPPSKGQKVGMTLSNIAVGVYVHHVEPGSEAQCAGIQEGSILVRYNGMGMLAEPTKQALERLWQYEGHFDRGTRDDNPVHLTFYHEGQLYTVVLLACAPFGISWAPCGNFPLVQRSYSFASAAGVRRGSLLAAVNGVSMRTMDHKKAAELVKDLFLSQQEISLTLCFTPPAARTSQLERSTQTAMNKRTAVSTDDGVEVRVHPLAYSIGTLFQQGATPSPKMKEKSGGDVAKLGSRVAAGEITAPTGFERDLQSLTASDRTYQPCPPITSLKAQWSAWDAIAYCLLFQQSQYHELPGATPINILQTADIRSFLLLFVNLVCELGSAELMATLLDQVEDDDAFRQRLYFLLRSYTATLETCKQNAVLEILQAAQLELTDCMQEESSVVEVTQLEQAPKEYPEYFSDPLTKSPAANGIMTPTKKKSVLRIFRKKSSSSPLKNKPPQKQPPLVPPSVPSCPTETTLVPISTLFENMSRFLVELNSICETVERSLLKSFSQKIADWALQPWSPSKHKALVSVTEGMREELRKCRHYSLINPIESSQVLTSVDPGECFILPSAHFPLLLTFNVAKEEENLQNPLFDKERIYRTRVELVSLAGSNKSPAHHGNGNSLGGNRIFFVHGAVSGVLKESGRSVNTDRMPPCHLWEKGNFMTFDTRSSWGAPQTLSLRLSSVDVRDNGCDRVAHSDESGTLHYSSEVGFCWIDLNPVWGRIEASQSKFATVMCHAQICSPDAMESFDEHGDLPESFEPAPERFEIELRVTTELLPFDEAASGFQSRKRMLLYKHDDDLRQELFAIEFIKTCDALLKASGLDLNLLSFRCIPVGAKQGFIEWVPGSVPLSDICKPHGEPPLSRDVSVDSNFDRKKGVPEDQHILSEVAKAGLTKYHSLHQLEPCRAERGSLSNNPIQDFLRSVAYDSNAPYLIRKDVMNTFVKSCAGYCMVTYLLGVGDRHLDNLLLHQTGHFFHCDYSFIFGEDPKTYQPMRITEDMVQGMGGKESDNYVLFLSLAGAAFLTLRRHENVRVLLAHVRLMVGMKEVAVNANPDQVLGMMRERLCLQLSDSEAVSYLEELIENSISSKLWMAVDAIHSLGKRF